MSRSSPPLAGLALLALCAAGCGAATRGTVFGRVSLDGQPVEAGSLRFTPTDGQSPTTGGAIQGGQYTAEVPLGEMRVEVSWQRVVGQKKAFDTPDSPMADVTAEAIPARYNSRSELLVTVRPGKNPHDFDLRTK